MFAKSERYYFDAAAIAESAIAAGQDRGGGVKYSQNITVPGAGKQNLTRIGVTQETRNKRNVWTLSPMATPHTLPLSRLNCQKLA